MILTEPWRTLPEYLHARNVDPRMTMGQLVGRIVQEALDRHDPSRPPRRARAGNRPAQGESEPAPASKEQATPEPGHAVSMQDAAIPDGDSGAGADAAPDADLRVVDREGSHRPPGRCRREAGRLRHSDGEAARYGPRDSGGGETAGVAAGRRPLQLPRSAHQPALQLTTPDRDRPRRAVCAGRRRRSRKSPIIMSRPSPSSARSARAERSSDCQPQARRDPISLGLAHTKS